MNMQWNHLTLPAQIEEADKVSFTNPVLIYKHSTRCSICSAALSRLERRWPAADAPVPYFVDVLQHRDVSTAIASRYGIEHESPQILLIKDGRCEFSRSHMAIDPAEIIG
jgi:bacillithiol system protein YtxJ